MLLGLAGSQNPFSGTPTYKTIAHLPVAERVRRMRDPEIRSRSCREDPKKDSTFPLFHRLSFTQMFRFGNPPNYQPNTRDASRRSRRARDRTPQEVAYDMLLEDDGQDFIYTPLGNYAYGDLSVSETTLDNRNCIMGLGDGGAHVAFILDAGYQTWLLTHWGRDQQRWDVAGTDPPPDVRHRAARPGCTTAACSQSGMKADVNVIDWDRLGCRQAIRRQRPAGRRQAAAAEGARLRRDDRVRQRHLPRRQADRHAARQAGARAGARPVAIRPRPVEWCRFSPSCA